MQRVSSMVESHITSISSRICRCWRWTASWEKACHWYSPALNMLSLLRFLSQPVHLSYSFSVVNHLYSIIFVRFANDNPWQSHFLFAHYSPQYPAKMWMTGLQKSYIGTLRSRTAHRPHSPRITANWDSIIRADDF